jgi:hypothetical protein
MPLSLGHPSYANGGLLYRRPYLPRLKATRIWGRGRRQIMDSLEWQIFKSDTASYEVVQWRFLSYNKNVFDKFYLQSVQ